MFNGTYFCDLFATTRVKRTCGFD